MIRTEVHEDGVVEVVVDHPPVNALPVQGWFDLAEAILSAGRDKATRAVVLRAEGRGFNAGVDIKEFQKDETFNALVGANRGCHAAFGACYECPVPVITAVQGFCLGGGIGLAGNSDIVIASDDATFGLPEVDRGALGAATHLSRLVPLHKARAMVYTSATATAQELHEFGSVLHVVPRDQLRDKALEVARTIASKDPIVMRMAKESLAAIDLWDVHKSYRIEQSYTFELNLLGVADKVREGFWDVSAHEAIRNLLGTYCEVMDAGDFDALGQLFADGVLLDDKSREIARGSAAVTALWTAMVRRYDGSPRTRHLVTGPVIEVDGDRASCRASFAVLQQVPGGPLVPVAAGRYRDAFACTDRRWHFTSRQFFLDQEGDMSQHMVDL